MNAIRIVAIALAACSISACSGGGSPQSALPSAKTASPTNGSRHPMIPSNTINAWATITAPGGGPPVAGQLSVFTMNFWSPNPQQFLANFVWTSPIPNTTPSYAHPIYFIDKAPITNTCTGLNVQTPAKYATSFHATAPAMVLMPAAGCYVSVYVIPGTATSYPLNDPTNISAIPQANDNPVVVPEQTNVRSTPEPMSTPNDHVYVPVTKSMQVQVFAEGGTTPVCTIQSQWTAPIAVAVHPVTGTIYVLDGNAFHVTAYQPLSAGCSSTPIADWPVIYDGTSIAIDQSDQVVVTGCGNSGVYPQLGGTGVLGTIPGECITNISSDYWDNFLYASDSNSDDIIEGQLAANDTLHFPFDFNDASGEGKVLVAAIGPNFYFDSYYDCPGQCFKQYMTSGFVQPYNIKAPYGNVVQTQFSAFNNSIAYDPVTGWLAIANGGDLAWPKIPTSYKATIIQTNQFTNAAVNTTFAFPAMVQLSGIAVGP